MILLTLASWGVDKNTMFEYHLPNRLIGFAFYIHFSCSCSPFDLMVEPLFLQVLFICKCDRLPVFSVSIVQLCLPLDHRETCDR